MPSEFVINEFFSNKENIERFPLSYHFIDDSAVQTNRIKEEGSKSRFVDFPVTNSKGITVFGFYKPILRF